MIRRVAWLLCLLLIVASARAQIVQFSGAPVAAPPPTCSSSLVDAVPASPGSYTFGVSTLRKIRAAYNGHILQLQRTSDNSTQEIDTGSGCSTDVATANSFCSTASLSVTSTSSRVALPSGSSIFVLNRDVGKAVVYVKLGNSSVVATTADTAYGVQMGQWVTVGANTNLAAITVAGSGDGTGTNTVLLTNCGVSKLYDQISTNDAVQATQANQLAFFPTLYNGLPGAIGSGMPSGGTCKMTVADSATYKTAVVHIFASVQTGVPDATSGSTKLIVGYPNSSTSDGLTNRFGLSQQVDWDTLNLQTNASSTQFNNAEGFGAAFQTIPMVYDVSTAVGTVRYLNTSFATLTSTATVTYVGLTNGLRLGAGANSSEGCGNILYGEVLLASATQTTPANVVNNMVTFASVALPTTSATTADGFTWTRNFIGGFAPSPPNPGDETINGNPYASEGAWQLWSQWKATNVKTSGTTALGDYHRFEMRAADPVWGSGNSGNRQELDGFDHGSPLSLDTTYWIAYAFQLETGYSGVSSVGGGWNIPGQMHDTTGGAHSIASNFYWQVWDNQLQLVQDDPSNPGCTPFVDCQHVVWSSASNFVVAGTNIQIVFQVKKSTSGTTDVLNLWVNGGGGVGSPTYSCSGSCFWNDTGQWYWKIGIYRGTFAPINSIPNPQAWRYCNLQVTTSSLSAQVTTPLDPCTQHNFLLKRDFDPAANDNSPMWLNQAA